MGVFSCNLKSCREHNKLTRTEVAKSLDVAYSTYCNWENSNREPNLKVLVQIADYFEVTVDSLLR